MALVIPEDLPPLNVLLVEDSSVISVLIQAYLRTSRHQLDIARDGEEALRMFKLRRYDVVLMDMQMPILDGYAATKAIREWERAQRRQPTPVLALTAHDTEDEIARSLSAGCTAHLSKPIRKETLLDALAQCRGNAAPEFAPAEKMVVRVDPELKQLIPSFLAHRRTDMEVMRKALTEGDLEKIRNLGHIMKGASGGFGFDRLSEIGHALERAAETEDLDRIRDGLDQLADFLSRVDVAYD